MADILAGMLYDGKPLLDANGKLLIANYRTGNTGWFLNVTSGSYPGGPRYRTNIDWTVSQGSIENPTTYWSNILKTTTSPTFGGNTLDYYTTKTSANTAHFHVADLIGTYHDGKLYDQSRWWQEFQTNFYITTNNELIWKGYYRLYCRNEFYTSPTTVYTYEPDIKVNIKKVCSVNWSPEGDFDVTGYVTNIASANGISITDSSTVTFIRIL